MHAKSHMYAYSHTRIYSNAHVIAIPLSHNYTHTHTHTHTHTLMDTVSFVSFISAPNKAFLCTQRREREGRRGKEERERGREIRKTFSAPLFGRKKKVLIQFLDWAH